MIDRTIFLKEVNNLELEKNLYDKMMEIYNHYCESIFSGKVDPNTSILVDHLLDHMFSSTYNTEINIPLSFINSSIGEVLFTLKFNSVNAAVDNLFTPADVSIIADRTLSTISLDITTNKLQAYVLGKKTYIITEKNLLSYLINRNFSIEIASKRIKKYLLLRSQNLTNSKIKEMLNQD